MTASIKFHKHGTDGESETEVDVTGVETTAVGSKSGAANAATAASTSREKYSSQGDRTKVTLGKKSSGSKGQDGSRGKKETRARERTEAPSSSESELEGRSRSRIRRNKKAVITNSGSNSDGEVAIVSVQEGDKPVHLNKETRDKARATVKEATVVIERMLGREYCPSLLDVAGEGGRGRPATTGEHHLKMLGEAFRNLVEKAEELKALRDGMIPANLSANRRVEEKKALEELRFAPSEHLPAAILEAVNTIDVVNERSKSMKGEFRGRLNKAAAMVKAATTLFVQRFEDPVTGHEKDEELEVLRSQLAAQQQELATLKEARAQHLDTQREVQELRNTVEMLRRQVQRGREERQGPMTRGEETKKRKILESAPGEDEPNTGRMESMGLDIEATETPTATPAATSTEEEQAEISRARVLDEIAATGMPAAVRPSLLGSQRVLDPAVPPAPTNKEDQTSGMESRLATMMVTCVKEELCKMGGHFSRN